MYMKTRMKKSKREREIDLEWLIITSEECYWNCIIIMNWKLDLN